MSIEGLYIYTFKCGYIYMCERCSKGVRAQEVINRVSKCISRVSIPGCKFPT